MEGISKSALFLSRRNGSTRPSAVQSKPQALIATTSSAAKSSDLSLCIAALHQAVRSERRLFRLLNSPSPTLASSPKGTEMSPEISNVEAIQMMNRCKHEIISLRRELDSLRPKAEAYDNLAAILRLLPRPPSVAGEDLVWTLDQRISELRPKKEEKPE